MIVPAEQMKIIFGADQLGRKDADDDLLDDQEEDKLIHLFDGINCTRQARATKMYFLIHFF